MLEVLPRVGEVGKVRGHDGPGAKWERCACASEVASDPGLDLVRHSIHHLEGELLHSRVWRVRQLEVCADVIQEEDVDEGQPISWVGLGGIEGRDISFDQLACIEVDIASRVLAEERAE